MWQTSMKTFELSIRLRDWVFIKTVAIVFSSIITVIIYILLGLQPYHGLITGAILGGCLTLMSFTFIGLSNKFVLPKIYRQTLWWIVSAVFSFFAGCSGFYLAYLVVSLLPLKIPSILEEKAMLLSALTGVLNYLIGLLIYLFINSRAKRTELESLLTESRLHALNTQLNSHFLFNILNSISELISIDGKKAEEAVLKLSKFLRRTLRETDLICLSEELENVKTYVELENIRYNGLIELKIELQESFLSIKIPKFSVQLIVENAVKHGFTGQRLQIDIFGEDTERFLKIHIRNNGRLPERINFGTGLKNLQRRVKILCNGYIEFRISNQLEFTINLPK